MFDSAFHPVQITRRQGIHPWEFLYILPAAYAATEQNALFNNSS